MPQVQHKDIPDNQLHEPKGVVSATSGQVYTANGSGSGVWKHPAGTAYGELYIAGNTTSQTLSTASAYSKLNPSSAWQSNGGNLITLDGANGQLTVTQAGVYQLSFWAHFTTAALASGTVYNFKYALNGAVGSRLVAAQKPTNGADSLNVSATGIVSLPANTQVSIYAAGDGTSSNTAIIVKEAGLSAVLLKVS